MASRATHRLVRLLAHRSCPRSALRSDHGGLDRLGIGPHQHRCQSSSREFFPPPSSRFGTLLQQRSCFSTSSLPGVGKEESTAMEMIKYARSLKGDEASYAEAVRVLEQGLSYFTRDGLSSPEEGPSLFTGDGPSSAIAAGRLQLTLATIHANRANVKAAAEWLQQLVDTTSASLEVRGAALEALTGLCLQTHQDDAAVGHANSFLQLLEKAGDGLNVDQLQALKCRATASRRLVDLACACLDTASELCATSTMPSLLGNASGAAALAYAESFHAQGRFSLAKELYEKSIQLSKEEFAENGQDLSATAMTPEEVHIGALAGLGQLLTLTGSYDEAEDKLTQALKQAERVKGEQHPQVGIILSCIGYLYQHRGRAEGGGDALLIEAMYKSALDLLKAPPVDQHDSEKSLEFKEIMAVIRARLGVILAPAFHRRSEAIKLRQWVEAAWKNPRPLPELLLMAELLSREVTNHFENNAGFQTFNKTVKGETMVIDVRLGRVF